MERNRPPRLQVGTGPSRFRETGPSCSVGLKCDTVVEHNTSARMAEGPSVPPDHVSKKLQALEAGTKE